MPIVETAEILSVASGTSLWRHGPDVAATRPGSTVKPFTLIALMEAGLDPAARRLCRRELTIGGRRFDCTHPPLHSLDAREAIAYSCNSYFASAVSSLDPRRLERAFAAHSLPLRVEGDPRLAALGEEGLAVTPLILARAYRELARSRNRVLKDALTLATTTGTARLAGDGFAGKTGTAATRNRLSLQAWFAGWTPREAPEHVMVVFLPVGRGASDAAPAARRLYESWRRGKSH
jgi:cell division protein FtsI/penicillin-binding protein 2